MNCLHCKKRPMWLGWFCRECVEWTTKRLELLKARGQ